MNTPVREGETIEGSHTTRNRPYPVLKCSSHTANLEMCPAWRTSHLKLRASLSACVAWRGSSRPLSSITMHHSAQLAFSRSLSLATLLLASTSRDVTHPVVTDGAASDPASSSGSLGGSQQMTLSENNTTPFESSYSPAVPPAPQPLSSRITPAPDDGGCDGGISCSTCLNSCHGSSDGICDDGGDGSTYDVCEIGSDCDDCGPRLNLPPPSPPPPTPPTPIYQATTVVELRQHWMRAVREETDAILYIPSGAHFRLGRPLICGKDIRLTIFSSGPAGAILDGMNKSQIFQVKGCSLTLRGLSLINGYAPAGLRAACRGRNGVWTALDTGRGIGHGHSFLKEGCLDSVRASAS